MAADATDKADDIIEATVVETSSEEATTTEAPSSNNVQDSAGASHTVNDHKHKGLWFFTIINFLFICAVIAAGYWYWLQQQQASTTPNPAISALETSLSQVSTQLNSVSDQLQANATLTNDQQTLLLALSESNAKQILSLNDVEQQQQLNTLKTEGLAGRIADVTGRRPSDWLLAEADYLVKLAGKKLWLEEDVKSAIMLLKSADLRISDLSDASLLPVRALLAQDIQTLQQINLVETESIALSISALIAQVTALPLDTMKLPEIDAPQTKAAVSDDINDWQANLKASWDAIVTDFVTVEKRTAAVMPFMSGKQQWLAREQLKFALLNAQQAIMQHQSSLYQQAIAQSIDIVNAHYQLDNTGVEAYIVSLQDLLAVDTDQVLPAQLDAQQPLSEIIEQRIQTLFAGGR